MSVSKHKGDLQEIIPLSFGCCLFSIHKMRKGVLEAGVVSFQSARLKLFVPWVQEQLRTNCPGAAALTQLSGAGSTAGLLSHRAWANKPSRSMVAVCVLTSCLVWLCFHGRRWRRDKLPPSSQIQLGSSKSTQVVPIERNRWKYFFW